MRYDFPSAIPELPVSNVDTAAAYYERCLGFRKDWGGEERRNRAGLPRALAECF